MKVYSVRGTGHYGGGIAIVAAESEGHARSLAGTIRDDIWQVDYVKGEVTELEVTADRVGIVDHYEMGE